MELGRHQGGPSTISFKAEFMGKKPERAITPLAWALFLLATLPVPVNTIRVSVSSQPTYADCLNAGYAAMLDNDMPEAIRVFLCRPTVSTAILPDGSTVSASLRLSTPWPRPTASRHLVVDTLSLPPSFVISGDIAELKINFLLR